MSLVGFRARNHPQQATRDDVDDRKTTAEMFDALSHRFGGFTLDVAAAPHNTKCDRYFTREQDGLSRPWDGERVWCNPPYSGIEPWVLKAHAQAETTPLIVMLLPANRTEQGWWQRSVEPYRDRPGGALRVEFLAGRPRFHRPGATIGPKGDRPPFGCCLLIWNNARLTSRST